METMTIENNLDMSAGAVGLIYKNDISTQLANLMEEITRLLEVDETYNVARIYQYIDEYDPYFFEKYNQGFLFEAI